jgi:alkylresorcinol/alkylpyrone synthase
VPPFRLGQKEVRERAGRLFGHSAELERMFPVFGNAGIETRYSCVPLDWYDAAHGWTDRNGLYLEHSVGLLEKVARDCLAESRLEAEAIDALVVVSTTGIATPSLDARLIDRLGLRPDLVRLPLFGLGCAGGVIGLSRAALLAQAMPGANVLLLVVELCTLSFRRDDRSKSNIVATALFGDGAAGAVLSCRGDGPALGAAGEHTWPQSLDIMGWDVVEDGLKALFSRDIPMLVRRDLRRIVDGFLARHGLGPAEIDRFVCHPGGAKVLSALEDAFELPQGALGAARDVLRHYGNMSSVTVLFVLRQMLRENARGRLLLTALGPGFTAGFQLLEAP